MRVITTIYRHAELLPHFLAHYSRLGVTAFAFGIHGGEDSPCWEQVKRATHHYRALCVPGDHDSEYSSEKDRAFKQKICHQLIRPEEWWAVADLDEFHEYPLPVKRLCRAAERRRCDHVAGILVDRLSANGLLPPIRKGSLWRQYPYMAKLTGNLLGGNVHKLMLVKGHGDLGTGHHWLNGGRVFPSPGLVHHFKWNVRALERVAERYQLLRNY
jgi:hypothetical protein